MEFHSILVPVNGSPADEEAIKLACRLAKKDKAKIMAVYTIPIDRTLPLDAELEAEVEKAERVLDRMESIGAGESCAVETDLLQARDAAPAVVDEAIQREADLIVIGTAYQRRFGQFSLGDLIPHVLKHAPCRVILYHQYTPDKTAQ
jgi:nucleotide-binding universal stress UspA family protein